MPARVVNAITARFLTLGGATVVVKRVTTDQFDDHEWECEGCSATSVSLQSRAATNRDANEHAGECRSMPLT